MSDTPDEPNNAMPDWYDPFSEPHTLPGGWDVSGWTSKQGSEQKASPEPNKRPHLHELFYKLALYAN
jgi:hypothetical protein